MTSKNNRAPFLYYIKLHHFKSIGKFKLELQSGNAQLGSKLMIFLSRVTLKFDGRPCKTLGHLFYTTSSFVNYFKASSDFKLDFTFRRHSIQVKINVFSSHVTLKSDGWPWKTKGYLFSTTSSCVHHFKPISEFKLELQPGNAQFGSKSVIFKSSVTLKQGWFKLFQKKLVSSTWSGRNWKKLGKKFEMHD